MTDFVDLEIKNTKLHFRQDDLEDYKQDIILFLENQDYMKNLNFAKQMMMSQEIKSNNLIEGITDDLSIIDEVIANKSSIPNDKKKRIINLYHGYQYILTHDTIDKDHLKELYQILSEGLLEPTELNNMGPYYRNAPVYILKGIRIDIEPYQGIDKDKIDYYMEQLFEYINTNNNINEIDSFIKSQILHFYFVYIHPYFDVNGRTSRTVSMWYLLNQKSYPYIIFNRAIAFAKRDYEKNIIRTRNSGNITSFLKYLLINVKKELEKESVINSIKQNTTDVTKEDLQMVEYLLSLNGSLTVKDLATIYNRYNERQKVYSLFNQKIKPLMEKEILIRKKETQSFIYGKQHNFNLGLNSDLINVDYSKIKYLNLKRFI